MDRIQTLIDEVRAKADETGFSGVVSVFHRGGPLYEESFGYADIAEKRKNNIDTRFGIASGTKHFTALGIGTLIDAGKLATDTTVRDIFGEDLSYVDPAATIAQLLCHTSGIWDYYDEDTDIDVENFDVAILWNKLKTPTDYLPLFEGKKPKFRPGERCSYSNGGYILLGIIIEKLTGQLYRDYIEEHVFTAFGMSDSGYFAFNSLPENTAYGYKPQADGSFETNIYNLPIRGGSDGGAYTTVSDIRKLWDALTGFRLLSPELTADYMTPHSFIWNRFNYGYGMYLMETFGRKTLAYFGGDAGVGFDTRYMPEEDLGFTIISNMTNGEEQVRPVIINNLKNILVKK